MSFPLLFPWLRPWFGHLIIRDDTNRVVIDFFKNHDDESAVGHVTPHGGEATRTTVPFADGSNQDFFDFRNRQIMLGDVLHVAI
jgi:hypothetical protein